MERKKIKILTAGPISIKGFINGPILTPYNEDVDVIFKMVTSGINVVEVVGDETIKLTIDNWNTDNSPSAQSAKADAKAKREQQAAEKAKAAELKAAQEKAEAEKKEQEKAAEDERVQQIVEGETNEADEVVVETPEEAPTTEEVVKPTYNNNYNKNNKNKNHR